MSVFILKQRRECKGKERDHGDPNFSEGQDETQLIFIRRTFFGWSRSRACVAPETGNCTDTPTHLFASSKVCPPISQKLLLIKAAQKTLTKQKKRQQKKQKDPATPRIPDACPSFYPFKDLRSIMLLLWGSTFKYPPYLMRPTAKTVSSVRFVCALHTDV